MVKYELEERRFRKMREIFFTKHISSIVWGEVLLGWETEELKRLLDESDKNARAIIAEIDNLLAMIKRRRNQ